MPSHAHIILGLLYVIRFRPVHIHEAEIRRSSAHIIISGYGQNGDKNLSQMIKLLLDALLLKVR